ncbi:MAG: hypothetical protein AAGA58_02485 [Verrucomicrobiota bacterium]
MKIRSLIALLAAASLGSVSAQNTAFTDPVGFFEVTLNPGFNFVSSGTANAVDYEGILDNTYTDTGAFSAGEFDQGATYPTHYLEIAEGVNEGARIDIASNTADTITPVDSPAGSAATFAGFLDGSTAAVIRKHRTISDIFGGAAGGTAPADLQIDAGTSAAGADRILIWNGTGFNPPIFYNNFFIGSGWSGATDAGNLPIPPGAGLVVEDNNGDSDVIVQDGHVKVTNTIIDLPVGFSLINSPVALDRTYSQLFGGSAGGTAPPDLVLQAGTSAAAADNILTWNGSGFDAPAFYNNFFIGAGWSPGDNSISFTDSFFVEVKTTPTSASVDFYDEDAGVAIP